MAIKSGWDCFGLEAARPTRNVVLRNLTIHSPTSAGVCIGSEISGGIANVRATDLVLRDVATGLRIKASRGRGAYVRNISYSNVSIEGFITHAIQVSDFYGQRNPSCGDRNASAAPRIAGIEYVDVVASAAWQWGADPFAQAAASFEGLGDQPITGVRLDNVRLPGARSAAAWDCRHVSGTSRGGVHPAPCRELQGAADVE